MIRYDTIYDTSLLGNTAYGDAGGAGGVIGEGGADLMLFIRGASLPQVYHRSARGKADFLAARRNSLGSLQDVLKDQEGKFGKLE
jgi:hypothetical protein